MLEIEYDNTNSYRFHSGDGGAGSTVTVSGIALHGNGLWTGNDFKVSGVGWDISQNSIPSVTIQNIDLAMSSIMLNNNIPDRPVGIWALYVYDRYIVTLNLAAASGATTLSVADTIPGEVTATGNLDFVGNGVYDKTFTSRTTNSIVLGATLATAMSVGTQLYIQGPGMNGSYTSSDVIPLFNGVSNEIELDDKQVVISLLKQSAKTQYVPNRYITKNNNFNWLPKTGTIIVWGNETFVLEKGTT